MKEKVVKVKFTEEEYKVLKKNAKYIYLTPKEYLKMLSSGDFCNGTEVTLPGRRSMISLRNGKDCFEKIITITDQGKFFREIIGKTISIKRAEKYRDTKGRNDEHDRRYKEKGKKTRTKKRNPGE